MTTTCKPCGSTFGGQAQHCCACHQTFSGTTAGDMHRTGDHAVSSGPTRRRCLTLAEMTERGMTVTTNAQGTWIWGTGRGQRGSFWLAQDESDGLSGREWGITPPPSFEALENEVSA